MSIQDRSFQSEMIEHAQDVFQPRGPRDMNPGLHNNNSKKRMSLLTPVAKRPLVMDIVEKWIEKWQSRRVLLKNHGRKSVDSS